MMQECREEWGEGQDVTSSDEDIPTTNQIADDVSPPISEEEYRKMLRRHHERQMRRKVIGHVVMFVSMICCYCRWSKI